MPLTPGTRLGPYEIGAPIGAGGMGEVYRARDNRLGRDVAVKVLPAEVAANSDRLRRFELEARAASALNHPNILVIHDIGMQDGISYVVSEFLEGETLRQKLKQGGLPLRKAVDYGIQTARGLAAAHAKGIVHRDLKPDNIFVTRDGRVKILDFGLAKTGATPLEGDRTETQITQAGTILGTSGYMSPEQVRGAAVDHRSDIFSYGIVLHETLTGRRVFTGDSFVETMNAILKEEPCELPESVPPLLRQIVVRCLEKQADERFESIRDVAYALESISGQTERTPAGVGPAAPNRPRLRRLISLSLAAGFGAAVIAGAWWWFGRLEKPRGLTHLTKLTRESGLTTDPALSPDGKLVAYASDRSGEGNLDIYVQQIGGGEPIRLTTDADDDSEPSFAPDATQIVFRSERGGGGIYVAPALGGEARRLTREGHLPRFSPDGKWISYWDGVLSGDHLASRIYIISLAGGKPTQLQPGFVTASYPAWAPDAKHILFRGRNAGGNYGWWVTPLDGGEAVEVGFPQQVGNSRTTGAPIFSADGRFLIFSRGTAEAQDLWRVPISARNWRLTGKPERLTFGTAIQQQPSVSTGSRIVFASSTLAVDLFALPLDANSGRVLGEPKQLTRDDANKLCPSVTPDGTKIAYLSDRSGYQYVWMRNLLTGKEAPLTASEASVLSSQIVLNREGTKVAYVTNDGSNRAVMAIPTDGGAPEKVADSAGFWDWSPDGRILLATRSIKSLSAILGIDIGSGQKSVLARHSQYSLYNFYFSPDGRWIAFEARNKPDRNKLHVIPFRWGKEVPESDWITVTDGSFWDDKPRWSPDGNMLYFVSYRDGFLCIWAIKLDSETKKPAGAPFAVYHSHGERRSLANFGLSRMYVPVAADKLVFPIGERRGNIWMAEFAETVPNP